MKKSRNVMFFLFIVILMFINSMEIFSQLEKIKKEPCSSYNKKIEKFAENNVRFNRVVTKSGYVNYSKSRNVAWNSFNEIIFGESWSLGLLGEVFDPTALKSINNSLSNIGLGLAMVQFAIDFSNGKGGVGAFVFAKNFSFYAIGKWGWKSLKIATFGVQFIDYALSSFGNAAIAARMGVWESAHKNYYDNKAKKTTKQWWIIFENIKSQKDIDSIIKKYMEKFWNDPAPLSYATKQTAGPIKVAADPLASEKKAIREDYLKYNLLPRLEGVFSKIAKETRNEQLNKLCSAYHKVIDRLNSQNSIEVQIKGPLDRIKNLPIRLEAQISGNRQVFIETTTDNQGKAVFSYTKYSLLSKRVYDGEIIVLIKNSSGEKELKKKVTLKNERSNISINLIAETHLDIKVEKKKPADIDDKNYTMKISVLDAQNNQIKTGNISIYFSGGSLNPQQDYYPINSGALSLVWQSPQNQQAKTQIIIKYLGDKLDPNVSDEIYSECKKTIEMPPIILSSTQISITPSLVDKEKKIWKLETQVKDDKGQIIKNGAMLFTATGGSLSNKRSVLKCYRNLKDGKYTKGWIEETGKQHIIKVRFLGDEKDPLIKDKIYMESETSIKLPPDPLEMSTVFVIDTSGSMRGSKLASAKAAVRLALAKYPGISKTEEWALFTFSGCGSCSRIQSFTQNPSNITRKLGFSASGGTPIAYSLKVASNYLRRVGKGKKGRIILLSDGGESCKGDPVDAADSIHRRKLYFTLSGN